MPTRRTFTLIEVLVVVAILALLAGLLLPSLALARLQAKLVRAHAELYQIALALQMYHDDWRSYPPARTFCAGGGMSIDDYNELPVELETTRCLRPRPQDVFNRGRRYKYIAPGYGYANNAPTILAIYVPADFPKDDEQSDPKDDEPYFKQDASPVKFAVWSVGPSGPKSVFDSDRLHYPVPRRTWYDRRSGPYSEGVLSVIRTGDRFIRSP